MSEFGKYATQGAYHWSAVDGGGMLGSSALTAATYRKLLRLVPSWSGKRVLDLGCGDGALMWLLRRNGAHVVGLDASRQGLALARQEFHKRNVAERLLICATGSELPFKDGQFDVVVMCEVLEHLTDQGRALDEAARVLNTEGKLVLSTPCRLTQEPAHDHHREFFEGELQEFLAGHFGDVTVQPYIPVWLLELYAPLRRGRLRSTGRFLINLLARFGRNPFCWDAHCRHYVRLAAICRSPRRG